MVALASPCPRSAPGEKPSSQKRLRIPWIDVLNCATGGELVRLPRDRTHYADGCALQIADADRYTCRSRRDVGNGPVRWLTDDRIAVDTGRQRLRRRNPGVRGWGWRCGPRRG